MSHKLQIAKCRSCDAAIVWMITRNGKNIPVDVDSVDECDLEWGDDDKPGFERAAGHVAHFETCPNAANHRRR